MDLYGHISILTGGNSTFVTGHYSYVLDIWTGDKLPRFCGQEL